MSRSPVPKKKKVFDGTIGKRHAPKIHNGKHMFRTVKDLNIVLEKGKGGGSKKTKKVGKNIENNGNKTSGEFQQHKCHPEDVADTRRQCVKAAYQWAQGVANQPNPLAGRLGFMSV
jgi:hypothetical protein